MDLLEARAEAEVTDVDIGPRTVDRTEQGVLPLGTEKYTRRDRPVDAETRRETGDKDVLLPRAGRLHKRAKVPWNRRRNRKVCHNVGHRYGRLVIEAPDRGTKERIGKELTKRISGSSPQSRIVNELERGLRVDRHIVPDAVGGIE
jgi:hypothetical protein